MTDEARAGEPRTERDLLQEWDAVNTFAISIVEIADREENERAAPHEEMAAIRFLAEQIIAYATPAIEREAAAELWQQGYAAGLERGRQPDNHPEAVAAPPLPEGPDEWGTPCRHCPVPEMHEPPFSESAPPVAPLGEE